MEQTRNSVVKAGINPTFVPTGERSVWARSQLRFIFSVARYNDFAKENLYSPYLDYVGAKQWGYTIGRNGYQNTQNIQFGI